jgi:hypothetical protein
MRQSVYVVNHKALKTFMGSERILSVPSASAQHLHRSCRESKAREIVSFRIAFSSRSTVCWIDETVRKLVPFIAIFNLGNKNGQPELNQGSSVVGIVRRSLVSPKTRRQLLKKEAVHCRAEDTRTNFPETQA